MCAVCTGHLLLRFETPRTQEAKKRKTAEPKQPKPPNKPQHQPKTTKREHRSFISVHLK